MLNCTCNYRETGFLERWRDGDRDSEQAQLGVGLFLSVGVGLLTLSGLRKPGVPGIALLSKGTYRLQVSCFHHGDLQDLCYVRNAAIISRIWQYGVLGGQVHGQSVLPRNKGPGKPGGGTQVAPALGSLSVSDWCLFSWWEFERTSQWMAVSSFNQRPLPSETQNNQSNV